MIIQDEIRLWLAGIAEHSDLSQEDQEEMEAHLLDSVDDLQQSGLREDEAYLIAMRRFGSEHELILAQNKKRTRQLWKQLYDGKGQERGQEEKAILRRENILTMVLLCASALASLVPGLLGTHSAVDSPQYLLNLSFFVLPFAGVMFIAKRWLRGETPGKDIVFPGLLLVLPLIANFYPFQTGGQTQLITVLHMPLALWLVFSLFRDPESLSNPQGRLDFLRFSGETVVYSVLVGLSAGMILLLTGGLFSIIDVDLETFLEYFALPVFLPLTVFLGIILVERKRSLVENFAPVLARIVSPPLLLVLLVFTAMFIGRAELLEVERELLIIMDVLLLAVIVVVIFSVSTRSEITRYRFQDWVNLLLTVTAFGINLFVLLSMVYRLAEYGISPNKLTSLGSNILLMGNLGLLMLYLTRRIKKGVSAGNLLSIQGKYFAVYYVWFMILILIFPLLFGFI